MLSDTFKRAANQAVSQTKKLSGEYHCQRRKDVAPQKDRKLAGPQLRNTYLNWRQHAFGRYYRTHLTLSRAQGLYFHLSLSVIHGNLTWFFDIWTDVSGLLSKLNAASCELNHIFWFGKIQGDGRKFLDRFKSYFGSQISSQSLNEIHICRLQPKSATKGEGFFSYIFVFDCQFESILVALWRLT